MVLYNACLVPCKEASANVRRRRKQVLENRNDTTDRSLHRSSLSTARYPLHIQRTVARDPPESSAKLWILMWIRLWLRIIILDLVIRPFRRVFSLCRNNSMSYSAKWQWWTEYFVTGDKWEENQPLPPEPRYLDPGLVSLPTIQLS